MTFHRMSMGFLRRGSGYLLGMEFIAALSFILILNKNLYHLLRYISYSFVGLLDRRQPVCVSRRAIRNISLISD